MRVNHLYRSLTALVTLAIALSFTLHTYAGPKAWPHENSDLSPDPTVVYGTLENGLRYVFMPNTEPPGRVSLRLRVDAGSLMEKEHQRGLAHFLEHMAFNGTRHFPADEMVKYFQRLGMAFGADTNAHTGYDETVYKLELPENSHPLMDDGLKLLRDYADGMLLEKAEIDKERGVILSEKRARDSVSFRSYKAQSAFMFQGTIIPERFPIGLEKVISSAPRQAFVDFYQKWYGTGQLTVVCVGDVDPKRFVDSLKKHFGSLPQREANPFPDPGALATPGRRAGLHTEVEAGNVTLTLFNSTPEKDIPDSLAKQRRMLLQNGASWIINRRLDKLAKQEDAPFLNAATYTYIWLDFVRVSALRINCKPEKWTPALATAEQQLRQALSYGFTPGEVDEFKAYMLNRLKTDVQTAPTRKSRQLANAIVSYLGGKAVFMSPAQELAWAEPVLENLTANDLHEALKSVWNYDKLSVFATGNLELEHPETTLLEAVTASEAVAVSPPENEDVPDFAYQAFGTPGTIVEQDRVDDLGIDRLRFSNNASLYIKKTDFQANSIRVSVRFGRGKLSAPESLPGLIQAADSTFISGGLGKHSHEMLKRILAGRNANVGFSVTDDAFVLSGSTTPEDLDLLLRLITAYITDPGFRPESLARFHRGLDGLYTRLKSTPEGISRNDVARFLAGGDFRFGLPDQTQLEKRTLDEVKNWLTPALKQAAMHIAIVGDLDPEKTVASVAETLGALPDRRKTFPHLENRRHLAFPPPAGEKTFAFTSQVPKAVSTVCWPTTDIWDISRTRRLGILASILDDRLRVAIREKQGDSYSPFAYSSSSEVYDGFGYVMGGIVADPDKAAVLAEDMLKIGAEIAAGGVTEDELERALTPQLKRIEEYRRSNGYWLASVLSGSREYPQRLDWARSMVDDYTSITTKELNRLAKTYLTPEKACRLLVVPDKLTESAGVPPAQ